MPSSTEPARSAPPTVEEALLEKIEELSLLRKLNDRLVGAPDFAAACRVLVDLVWEGCHADEVIYLSVDTQRGWCRVEAQVPGALRDDALELSIETPPFPELLGRLEPSEIELVGEPPWKPRPRGARAAGEAGAKGAPRAGGSSEPRPRLIGAPLQVRGTTTGLLVAQMPAAEASLEEQRRLLAIFATTASLGLDVARNDEREEFLATLRHDINNPVSVALGYTEMIVDRLQDDGPTDLLGLARSVTESLKAVADLVSNYLHMTAINRGSDWLTPSEIDLFALVSEIAEAYRPSAEEKSVALTLDGDPTPAFADRRQIGRVLSNLVSNAVKYTPGPGRIEIRVRGHDGGAILEVCDTGYGLTPEQQAHLFSKYGRFHRDTGIPGTGLGLYLSREIAEAHGGSIRVTSTPGAGSTFTLELPPQPGRAA
jgi:signal transduction histidine kinase